MIDEFMLRTLKSALSKEYEECEIDTESTEIWDTITIFTKKGEMETWTKVETLSREHTLENIMESVRFKEKEWKSWFEEGGHGIFGIGQDTFHRFTRWADGQIRLKYGLTSTISEVQQLLTAKETENMSDFETYQFIIKKIEEKYAK